MIRCQKIDYRLMIILGRESLRLCCATLRMTYVRLLRWAHNDKIIDSRFRGNDKEARRAVENIEYRTRNIE